ncbi:MAG TPA: TerC family protein [Terriglobia bacterium]|nr:TerC family protein [Terriglobia bacterium]
MLFLYSLLRIVVFDLVLSGDNAVVIGMAAHRLPPRQRRQAILMGGAMAIVLRIGLTVVAAYLLNIPGLQVVGGLLLLWIGFKLLKEEEESHDGVKVAASMREAIFTILIADLVMSTDNVLSVAAASEGNVALLAFGLVLSMIILLWFGSQVARLINRFVWLSYFATAIIAWTGTLMVFKDPLVARHAPWVTPLVSHAFGIAGALGVTGLAHWLHRTGDAPGEDSPTHD